MKLTHWMSRYRALWILWMTAGTPLMFVGFLLDVLWTTVSHLYATWHWRWKGEMSDWFRAFTERHRRRMRSLGMKPETKR